MGIKKVDEERERGKTNRSEKTGRRIGSGIITCMVGEVAKGRILQSQVHHLQAPWFQGFSSPLSLFLV